MKIRDWVGWILLVGLLSGCGTYGSQHLVAGRQLPLMTSHGNIRIHLNDTSELHFNLRGFRMGIAPHAASHNSLGVQLDPTPWLHYRLHF